MASLASNSLKLEKMEVGVETAWGTKGNNNYDIIDAAIAGIATLSTSGGTTTLDDAAYTNDDAKQAILVVTGTLTSNAIVVIPNASKLYRVVNETSGAYTVSVKTSSGTAIEVTQSSAAIIYCDGSNAIRFVGPITNYATGAPNTSSGAAASTVSVSPSGNLTSTNAQSALSELQGDIDSINTILSSGYQPLDSDLTAIAGLSSTKGNMVVGGASGWSALGIGTDGYALIADSASAPGMKWAALVPAGTVAIFYQSSAPTGWAISGSETNYALRLVTSGGGSATAGTGFTTVFAARTLTVGQMPTHVHNAQGSLSVTIPNDTHDHDMNSVWRQGGGTGSGGLQVYANNNTGTPLTMQTYSHNHGGAISVTGQTASNGSGDPIDFAVSYINVIKCAKSAY